MLRMRSIRSRTRICALAALLLVFGLAVPVLAQTDVTTSRISGTVEGTDKAPLPGVTVEATNKDTGLKLLSVTDAQGVYRILNLPTGTYSVAASLDGFATATAPNVRLLLGSTPTINFTLQSSKISETITVTSEAPLVEVTNTTVGTTIQQEQIKNIPSAGRDFRQFVLMTPESRLESERNTISLSGERGINTSVNVDGVDYNNAFFGGTVGSAEGRAPLSISQESIKEFSVVTNGASVEFGRSGGGFVNIITKNGTNNLRGSAFFFDQPHSLISNFPAGSRAPGVSLEPADQNKKQYGGSLGGPIVKDKLFYFLSYDKQKQDITIPILTAQLNPAFFTTYPALASSPDYVQTQNGSVAIARLGGEAQFWGPAGADDIAEIMHAQLAAARIEQTGQGDRERVLPHAAAAGGGRGRRGRRRRRAGRRGRRRGIAPGKLCRAGNLGLDSVESFGGGAHCTGP